VALSEVVELEQVLLSHVGIEGKNVGMRDRDPFGNNAPPPRLPSIHSPLTHHLTDSGKDGSSSEGSLA